MKSHRFDPISAVLGLLAVVGGLLVALGRWPAGAALGWWAIAAVIGVAILLVPWRSLFDGDDSRETTTRE